MAWLIWLVFIIPITWLGINLFNETQKKNSVNSAELLFKEPLNADIIGSPYDPPKVTVSAISIIIASILLILAISQFSSAFEYFSKASEYRSKFTSGSLSDYYQKEGSFWFAIGTLFLVSGATGLIYSFANSKNAREQYDISRVAVAKNKIASRLTGELYDSTIIPDNFKTLHCKKGLRHIEEDSQSRGLPLGSGYKARVWKSGQDLLYTYDLEHTQLFFSSLYQKADGTFGSTVLDKLENRLPVFKIDQDDFLFYTLEGDFYITTDVKGSGGGSDYGNALVGGALFGDAGAVVASRKEVKIETTTTEVDKRTTLLYYQYQSEVIDAHFQSNDFSALKELFPNKDANVLDRLAKKTPSEDKPQNIHLKQGVTEDDVTQKLDKLVTLKNKGYITEEEYSSKRKQILDQL